MSNPLSMDPPEPFDFWDPDNWPTAYTLRKMCPAKLYHGPGHQHYTTCYLLGEHQVHETVYGDFRLHASWRGDTAYSGAYDQPVEAKEADDEDRG